MQHKILEAMKQSIFVYANWCYNLNAKMSHAIL